MAEKKYIVVVCSRAGELRVRKEWWPVCLVNWVVSAYEVLAPHWANPPLAGQLLRLRLISAVDLTLGSDMSDGFAFVREHTIEMDDCLGRREDSYRSVIMHMAGRHRGTWCCALPSGNRVQRPRFRENNHHEIGRDRKGFSCR